MWPYIDLSDRTTNERLFQYPAEISSADFGWSSLFYQRRVGKTLDFPIHIMQNHYLEIKLNPLSHAVRAIGGRRVREVQHRGSTAYVPHGCSHSLVYPENMGDLIIITISPEVVDRVAQKLRLCDQFKGHPKFSESDDPFLMTIGLEIYSELRDGNPHGQVFGEIVGEMIAMHLIRSYGAPRSRISKRAPSLPSARIRRILGFIEQQIGYRIVLADLAAEVGLSEYHFSRAFRATTGLPPYRYILTRRVEIARQLLCDQNLSIQDIAFETGFSDASQFSKHFRKIAGMQPSQYRLMKKNAHESTSGAIMN